MPKCGIHDPNASTEFLRCDSSTICPGGHTYTHKKSNLNMIEHINGSFFFTKIKEKEIHFDNFFLNNTNCWDFFNKNNILIMFY